MKVAGGQAEDGIVIGNTYDKYGTRNPIARRMVQGFEGALSGLVAKVRPATIHEVGCGEGYWIMRWLGQGIDARGTDFSAQVIGMAKENARGQGMDHGRFTVRSIYDVTPEHDSADLIVCCEVMEHLEEPQKALLALQRIVRSDLILSVPREPLWRVLNLARGKYVSALGNTPGHLQHWSQRGIVSLVSQFFDVTETLSPLPWTMLHCKSKNRR
ncbi:MAG: methyltransferase domain-containing protein [Mesorhizobium sp.]|uniref:class I SAM-dependent methyltransferase n=1 Tax=unclassified Mesorhizobium TaxID=325217 RepID=UPI000F758C0A|nr:MULTISPECIES: class I SAM-dependent methyltransferase [unclassified Mesorhizobium]AZO48398.1 class I SAM-dependent methyltransferase [Mesorhizobium sp. M4B.F.Ca.ET.058.02.1.1]RVC45194.1 methyltransferase domain-containing protein [Mesorhizobium sp. M4A.F.Ca.ET.090.04.2.1]RWC57914.1 MAG: methyltransferase domain-containing protein [Mesorhizobium sp.]RWD15420.1 MAG: methyltransferase domain-containing protein [Mesorhizobium sp.]RWD56652.1 MAG: methyltransferase domain-containing protein [Meso